MLRIKYQGKCFRCMVLMHCIRFCFAGCRFFSLYCSFVSFLLASSIFSYIRCFYFRVVDVNVIMMTDLCVRVFVCDLQCAKSKFFVFTAAIVHNVTNQRVEQKWLKDTTKCVLFVKQSSSFLLCQTQENTQSVQLPSCIDNYKSIIGPRKWKMP